MMCCLTYSGRPSPRSSRSLSLACAMSRATISEPLSDEPRADRVLATSSRAQLVHVELVEVDAHHVALELVAGDLGQVLRRVGLELLEEDAVAR